jgi:Protein kinase domain
VNVLDIPKSIGRYEILERVARGGMGALYRARDPVLEREVAIKVMLADFSHDANGRTRFYREARAIARLQHRNIVTLFDYGEDEGNPFIVMEFLQGQTLAARVKHGPPVPLVQALATGAQLCTGLHFAHGSGIVHRDVKPANIWLEDDGGVKLLDFGIAKFGDTDVTQAGDVLGSISYMSPEQLAGGTIDGRSDIFSAGIVMFELLAGRRPFQGDSPTAIMMKIIHEEAPPLDAVPGAPAKLRGLIAKALEKNPDRRYQRAAEFASELRDLQISIERQQESVRAAQTDTVPEHPAGQRSAPGGAIPGAMLSSGEMATVTHTPAPLPGPRARQRQGAAPINADALLMRPAAANVDSDDPLSDVMIGGRENVVPADVDARASTARTGTRPAWVPAGAAAAIVVVVVVAFLLMRGGPMEVTGGAQAPDGSPSSLASSSSSAANTPAATPSAVNPSAANPSAAARYPDTGKDGGATASASAAPAPVDAPPSSSSSAASPPSPSVHVMLSGGYPFEVSGASGVLSRARTRHELNLAGPQTLRLRAAEYALDRRVEVTAKPGETVRLSAPALGRLTVRTRDETCQIFLGGLALGYPPISERPIASGTYRLTLRCPDGDHQTQTVTIPAGATYMALIQ